MRAYLWITGSVFAMMTVVHISRMAIEKTLLSEASFLGITALTAALAIWAFRLLRSASSAGAGSRS